MAFEPVKFVDSLAKGVIEAAYDFARLSIAGLAIPFIGKTRRFWPAVRSINKRLSSLTYLFLWVLIVASVAIDKKKMVATMAGLEKAVDVSVLVVIGSALLITMALDLSVRAACYWIRGHVRRELYKSAAHLAYGSIAFGAFLLMLVAPYRQGGISEAISIWGKSPAFAILFYPTPLMLMFSIPLAVIVAKTLRVVPAWRLRLLIGLMVGSAILLVLANLSFYTVLTAYRVGSWLTPWTKPALTQRATRCAPVPDGVRIAGFLTVRGAATYALDPRLLAMRYTRDGKTFSGRVRARQAGILLSSTSYVWVDLAADYDVEDTEKAPKSLAGCTFTVLVDLLQSDDDVKVNDPYDDEAERQEKENEAERQKKQN